MRRAPCWRRSHLMGRGLEGARPAADRPKRTAGRGLPGFLTGSQMRGETARSDSFRQEAGVSESSGFHPGDAD